MTTHILTQPPTEVKTPEWIAVDLPFSWGLRDSVNGLSVNEGFRYFVGAALTEYLKGWRAGLSIRILNLFGWEDASQVDDATRRAAIIAAAKGAADYITARTAQDTAFFYDRELYTCWPMQYRAARFAHEYMSNHI